MSKHSETSTASLSGIQIIEGIKTAKNEKELRFFQNQFFFKYRSYIYRGAVQMCLYFHDTDQLALDITQQTFILAFRKLIDFDFSSECDMQKGELLIKAWLGKISNNCFNKEYNRRKGFVYFDDLMNETDVSDSDIFESLYGDESIDVPNEFRLKLNMVLSSLTDEQKHIILTYADEGCINNNLHLSKQNMEMLCQIYQTSSANIRQIKKRTLDKIKKVCF